MHKQAYCQDFSKTKTSTPKTKTESQDQDQDFDPRDQDQDFYRYFVSHKVTYNVISNSRQHRK